MRIIISTKMVLIRQKCLHVTLPKANSSLREYIAHSIAKRRNRLLYWKSRQIALAETSSSNAPIQESNTLLQPLVERIAHEKRHIAMDSSNTDGVVFDPTSRSVISASEMNPHLFPVSTLSESGSTIRTSRSTSHISAKDLPKAPRVRPGDTHFLCNVCWMLCPVETGVGEKWKKHVLRDIEPYICHFESCMAADQFFASSRDWLQHMESCHGPLQWICSAKSHGVSVFVFETPEVFATHLKTEHLDHFDDSQVASFVQRNVRRAPLAFEIYPLCKETASEISQHKCLTKSSEAPQYVDDDEEDEGLKPAGSTTQSSSDNPGAQSLILDHLADHLISFALLSIPMPENEHHCTVGIFSSNGPDKRSSQPNQSEQSYLHDLEIDVSDISEIDRSATIDLEIPDCSSSGELIPIEACSIDSTEQSLVEFRRKYLGQHINSDLVIAKRFAGKRQWLLRHPKFDPWRRVDRDQMFLLRNNSNIAYLLNTIKTKLEIQFERPERLEDLEEAIQVTRRTIEITPIDNPNIASLFNNLGTILQSRFEQLGRVEDLEDAFQVTRQAVVFHQTKYDSTEEFDRHALQIEKTMARDQHLSILHNMNALAGVLSDQEKYEEAEEIYRQALQLWETVLGKQHPDTLASLNNLAIMLSHQEKYEEAKEMHRGVLEASEQELGPLHPDTLISVSNLALVLQYRDRYEAAEAMNRRALEGMERELGPMHPNTITIVINLASVLQDQGKYEAAEAMNRRALKGREQELGPMHPSTLTTSDDWKGESSADAQAWHSLTLQAQLQREIRELQTISDNARSAHEKARPTIANIGKTTEVPQALKFVKPISEPISTAAEYMARQTKHMISAKNITSTASMISNSLMKNENNKVQNTLPDRA